jgi:hypothetical protein
MEEEMKLKLDGESLKMWATVKSNGMIRGGEDTRAYIWDARKTAFGWDGDTIERVLVTVTRIPAKRGKRA